MSEGERPAKRRRLGGTPQAQKPFKSPFRGSPDKPPAVSTAAHASSPARPPPQPATPISRPLLTSPLSSTDSSTDGSKFTPASRSQPHPEITALQRQHTSLIVQSRNLRASFDTVKQALKIEETSSDAELGRLNKLWRMASQSAAEEIFATVKDRVNKMGGVVAWRQKEKERREKMEEWGRMDQEQEGGNEDEDSDEEEDEGDDGEKSVGRNEEREMKHEARAAKKEAREIAKAELEEQKEAVREKEEEKVSQAEQGRDDEGFTMDMMLKELKVDLKSIGFDAEAQRWCK